MRFSFIYCVAAVVAPCFAGLSCSVKGHSNSRPDIVFDTVCLSDSLDESELATKTSFKVEYPAAGPVAVVDSVNDWIACKLGELGEYFGPSSYDLSAVPSGDVTTMVRTCSDSILSNISADIVGESNPLAIYECDMQVSVLHSSPEVVTYSSDAYVYCGGAHGGMVIDRRTFSTADGRALGWNMFRPGSDGALRTMITDGLKRHFEVSSVDSLNKYLLVDVDTLPLPAIAPYFSAEGVHFLYRQYEIAPYYVGTPGCVLPYAAVDSLLTPEAKALVSESETL